MTLEEGLVAHLKADTAVAALIGGRVYHERLPQKPPYPAVAFARTSTDRLQTLGGPSALSQVRVALDVWASSTAEMRAVAGVVRAALDGVTGNLGGTSIDQCYVDGQADLSEFEGDRADRRVSMELVIWLNE